MSTRTHHRAMGIGGRIRRYAMFFSVLCLGVLAAGQVRAADAVVTDLQSGVSGDGARFVLHLDRRVGFRLFTLADPYRVVVDLPEVGWQLPAKPLPGKQGVFNGLRYGCSDRAIHGSYSNFCTRFRWRTPMSPRGRATPPSSW